MKGEEGLRHIEGRPCEDEDRGWMDAPTHQAMPRTADGRQKSRERPGMDSPSEPPEEVLADYAYTLTSDF